MVKFLVIGDPHGSEEVFNIPIRDPDCILIPGDLGKAELLRKRAFAYFGQKKSWTDAFPKGDIKKVYMEVFDSSLKVLKYFAKYAPVYLVYGNVELTNADIRKLNRERGLDIPLFEDKIKKIRNVHVINDKVVNFNGICIAGNKYFLDTEWVREFTPNDKRKLKIAKNDEERAKKFYSRLGKVDILMCHQPPKGYLDMVGGNYNPPKNWIGKHAGSSLILNYIKKYQPKYVVCWHIHEAKGKAKIGKTTVFNVGCAGDYVDLKF